MNDLLQTDICQPCVKQAVTNWEQISAAELGQNNYTVFKWRNA